ncbi:MAG: rhodanese-related sulfurtransferase [Flavobacteriales bacterium]|nr:rhodanese-related sulfurtransferase [Flavobacteriales bacterium]MBP9080447.1 rhodanese-related sulfurtransferase [Flavobacteriales bacterium]
MHPHRLRNLLHPELLRSRSEQEARPRTTLSFYRYALLSDVEALRHELYIEWRDLGVLGRTYLATEGINAQISLPKENLGRFRAALDARPEFHDVPWKIAVEDDGKSFLKLTIKVKKKIVADGLADNAFDVAAVGAHLDAETFNRKMEEGALVIDMRNNYECAIGHFEGAYLPKAGTFRGAIEEVVEMLNVQPMHNPDQGACTVDPPGRQTDAPEILLYCTGGIRCEKASAFLKHHGYTKVGQLHGGIIDYARQIKALGLPSKYRGRNFVFDERLAERITDHVVGTCMQCGTPCDRITNCHEATCNMLLVQCEACAQKYADCCSPSCREIHLLPLEAQRAWRKGRSTRSTKTKAITDPDGLKQRIAAEEALLAAKGTLHPALRSRPADQATTS